MTKKAVIGLVAFIFLTGLIFRIAGLGLRPMHHDEANQALKFGALLEKGEYRYDPQEHHGPVLYYLTLPVAWMAGAETTAELTETVLRLVPAVLGAGLILLLLLMAGGLGREAMIFAGAALALSPFMIYFSRFYIQETPFVFFTAAWIASGWRFFKHPSAGWAALAGIAAGAAYAAKETSLIVFGAAFLSIIALYFWEKKTGRKEKSGSWRYPAKASFPGPKKTAVGVAVFLATAAATAWLFFSSFGTNPAGLLDSVRAIGIYADRGLEGGSHAHPFWFYFKMLAFPGGRGPGLWSEAFILALAVAGAIGAFHHDSSRQGDSVFKRFILFYTLTAALMFSAIPYKTPWNAMPFYLGVILLAGSGAELIWSVSPHRPIKAGLLVLILPGFINLGLQSYRANFKYHASVSNPYVYAQTSNDYLKLVTLIENVTAESPEGRNTLIVVAAPADRTWPLPWSLRKFTRVGYWERFDLVPAEARQAGIIITPPGPWPFEDDASHIDSYFELRPGILLCAYVRNDLWNEYLERRNPGK